MLTEFGGIDLRPGPRGVLERLRRGGHRRGAARAVRRPGRRAASSPVVAGFCYTQLTDTEQERNGLLAADRVPKVDPALIAEINRQPSAAVPGEAMEEVQIVHAAGRADRHDAEEQGDL